MRVLVAGDRNWKDVDIIRRELQILKENEPSSVIIHGKCHLGGADIIAGEIGRQLGFEIIECPADWTRYGKKAGPIRNQYMIDTHDPEFALLFHKDIEHSKGTKDMRKRLIAASIGYKVVTS